MACNRCVKLNGRVIIRNQDELTRVIRMISAGLEDGALAEFVPHPVSSAPRFADWAGTESWPDFVENYFHCDVCGDQFRLVVETYKGMGGTWRRYTWLDRLIEGAFRRRSRLL
jgi:hypothetical protein